MSVVGRFFRRPLIWRSLYFIFVTAALLAIFHDWTYDDPFITYRYARNLSHGLGFVYNPGEAVLSTTTPLFALLLAALQPLGVAQPVLANAIGTACLALGGLLLADIIRRLRPAGRWSAAWTGLLLYPTFPLLASTIGSETPLYLALCLAAVDAFLGGWMVLTGALLGLAALARADALVLAAVLVLMGLSHGAKGSRPRFQGAAVAFGLVVLPWLVFSWRFFGSAVPITLPVKQSQNLLPNTHSFLSGLWELIRGYSRSPQNGLLGLLTLAGAVSAIRRGGAAALLLAWPALYTAAYTALGVPDYFWYYAVPVLGLLIAVSLGMETLAARLPIPAIPWTVRPPGRARIHPAVLHVLLALILAGQLVDLARLAAAPDERYSIYRAVGEWFAENTLEDASIGILEVGIVGYYAAPRPMIDFSGLIRPAVAARFEPGFSYPQAALWVAERYQPDYLVVTGGRYRDLLEQFTVVRCVQVASFAGADYGFSKDFLIYLC